MHENAFAALLAARDERNGMEAIEKKSFIVFFGGLAFFVVIGSLILLTTGEAHQLDTYSLACFRFMTVPLAAFLAFGVPLVRLVRDGSVHTSFLRGRCYDEILGTQLSATEVVDGVAWRSASSSIFSVWRSLLLSGLLLIASFPQYGLLIATGTAVWIPAVVLLTWSASYVVQLAAIWGHQLAQESGLARALVGLGASVPALSCLGTALASWSLHDGAIFSMSLLAYLGFTVGLCRWLAKIGLESLPQACRKARSARLNFLLRHRNPYVLRSTDNPVVARELSREARKTPFGLVGWLVLRHWLLLIFLAVWCPLTAVTDNLEGFFWSGLCFLACTQWALSAQRTRGAVITEIEQKTLSPLEVTGLSARDYTDGWLQVGAYHRSLQNVFMAVFLSAWAWKADIDLAVWFFLALAFIATPWFGAAAGLYASVAPNRREVSSRFLATMFLWPLLFAFALAMGVQSLAVATLFLPPSALESLFTAGGFTFSIFAFVTGCVAILRTAVRQSLGYLKR